MFQMRIFYKINVTLFGLLILITAASVNAHANSAKESPASDDNINLTHFNHLYKEIEVVTEDGQKKTMGIMHIYSEAPNYRYAIEPAEGFTCVDDVARAIIFLADYIRHNGNNTSALRLKKQMKMLIEFVLHMQNVNGYFNNFIWHDYSINSHYKTSLAEMNWWSFRALWSLQFSLDIVKDDAELYQRMDTAINTVVANLKMDLSSKVTQVDTINGLTLPTWLPNKMAADQGALAIISLLPYYKKHQDPQILAIINALAKGIMTMQKGDADHYPYGMFLSWQNLWHSWGNNQAYALLLAGQQLNNVNYINSALVEVDNFYPYILDNGFAEAIWIEKKSGQYKQLQKKSYPQIAYGIRPMVFAAAQAYEITGDNKYLTLMTRLQSWFFGNNDTGKALYNPANGLTFDAINSAQQINHNSGAESTIESLLVMLKTLTQKAK